MLNTDPSSDVSVVGPFDNAVLREVVSRYLCNYLNNLMLLKHFLLWCKFNDIGYLKTMHHGQYEEPMFYVLVIQRVKPS